MSQVSVIGSGSWGTAITGLLARHVDVVKLWCRNPEVAQGINLSRHNPRHLMGYRLEPNVAASASLEETLQGAQYIIIAIPSAFLRGVCQQMASFVDPHTPVMVLTKGIEPHTQKLMSDVVADELGAPERICVLSGPNHAEEICQADSLSAAVVASTNKAIAAAFREILVAPTFRVYVSQDITGVEVCGATKNVIAIACGGMAGIGAGDNTLAVVMTRGLAEITRIATAMGGNPLTCMGLAGMGDLVATCTSLHSRNRSFGMAFAQGESVAAYEQRSGMVVEGAVAAQSVRLLALTHKVEAPITNAVYEALYEHKSLEEGVSMLLDRMPYDEFYGLDSSGEELPHA